jgi:hypothetical protein
MAVNVGDIIMCAKIVWRVYDIGFSKYESASKSRRGGRLTTREAIRPGILTRFVSSLLSADPPNPLLIDPHTYFDN